MSIYSENEYTRVHSYIEFMLDPSLLITHCEKLKHHEERFPSGEELIRIFLEESIEEKKSEFAQKAIILPQLAARVASIIGYNLEEIEQLVPLRLQRKLLTSCIDTAANALYAKEICQLNLHRWVIRYIIHCPPPISEIVGRTEIQCHPTLEEVTEALSWLNDWVKNQMEINIHENLDLLFLVLLELGEYNFSKHTLKNYAEAQIHFADAAQLASSHPHLRELRADFFLIPSSFSDGLDYNGNIHLQQHSVFNTKDQNQKPLLIDRLQSLQHVISIIIPTEFHQPISFNEQVQHTLIKLDQELVQAPTLSSFPHAALQTQLSDLDYLLQYKGDEGLDSSLRFNKQAQVLIMNNQILMLLVEDNYKIAAQSSGKSINNEMLLGLSSRYALENDSRLKSIQLHIIICNLILSVLISQEPPTELILTGVHLHDLLNYHNINKSNGKSNTDKIHRLHSLLHNTQTITLDDVIGISPIELLFLHSYLIATRYLELGSFPHDRLIHFLVIVVQYLHESDISTLSDFLPEPFQCIVLPEQHFYTTRKMVMATLDSPRQEVQSGYLFKTPLQMSIYSNTANLILKSTNELSAGVLSNNPTFSHLDIQALQINILIRQARRLESVNSHQEAFQLYEKLNEMCSSKNPPCLSFRGEIAWGLFLSSLFLESNSQKYNGSTLTSKVISHVHGHGSRDDNHSLDLEQEPIILASPMGHHYGNHLPSMNELGLTNQDDNHLSPIVSHYKKLFSLEIWPTIDQLESFFSYLIEDGSWETLTKCTELSQHLLRQQPYDVSDLMSDRDTCKNYSCLHQSQMSQLSNLVHQLSNLVPKLQNEIDKGTPQVQGTGEKGSQSMSTHSHDHPMVHQHPPILPPIDLSLSIESFLATIISSGTININDTFTSGRIASDATTSSDSVQLWSANSGLLSKITSSTLLSLLCGLLFTALQHLYKATKISYDLYPQRHSPQLAFFNSVSDFTWLQPCKSISLQNQVPLAQILEQTLVRLFEIAPSDFNVALSLGDVFHLEKHYDEALRHYLIGTCLESNLWIDFGKQEGFMQSLTKIIDVLVSQRAYPYAVVLHQFSREVNFKSIFKLVQQFEYPFPDCLVNYLWEMSLLEILTNIYHKENQFEKRDKFILRIGKPVMNECNLNCSNFKFVRDWNRREFLNHLTRYFIEKGLQKNDNVLGSLAWHTNQGGYLLISQRES